jgi:hypothetical protein
MHACIHTYIQIISLIGFEQLSPFKSWETPVSFHQLPISSILSIHFEENWDVLKQPIIYNPVIKHGLLEN